MNHQLEIISDFCRGSVCCCHFSKPADGEEKRRTCSVSFMLIYSLLSLTFRLHVLLYLIIPLLPVNTHSHTHSHTALSCFSPHTTSPPQPPHMLFDKWMVSPHQAHDNVHRWEVETGTRASSKHAHRAKSSTYVAVIQTAMLTDTSRRSGSMAKQEGLFFFEQQSRRKYLIYWFVSSFVLLMGLQIARVSARKRQTDGQSYQISPGSFVWYCSDTFSVAVIP